MYKTISEVAEELQMPVSQVQRYIFEGKIKAVDDGKEWLINMDQFTLYFEQLEHLKEQIKNYWEEPLPPDRNIKDED